MVQEKRAMSVLQFKEITFIPDLSFLELTELVHLR